MAGLLDKQLMGQETIRGLLAHYRSGIHNLGKDFFQPCLRYCSKYQRAVGYFSSQVLVNWLEVLPRFCQDSVVIHLLISPELSAEDRLALEKLTNEEEKQKLRQILADQLIRELVSDVNDLTRIESARIKLFTWMVANDYLVLKFAFPEHLDNPVIFHSKIGIFYFPWGDHVAFTGSANESVNGYERNYESIDVYRSWIANDAERVTTKVEEFEEAWLGKAKGLKVLSLSPELMELIRKKATSEKPFIYDNYTLSSSYINLCHDSDYFPQLPDWLTLRPYQKQAVDNWFTNNGRGTLKMATGSGKTITALAIASRLYEEIKLQALIIICPYRHLVQQWAQECQKFGITKPILAFESVKQWQEPLSNQLFNVSSEKQKFLTVITTNSTLITSRFQAQLSYFPKKTLIIGDEAHNLGSERLKESLPRSIGLRLALSATPERYFDEEGTEALFDYFGSVLKPEFTLRDAIEQGALVHYLYYPVFVEMNESEAETYLELTKQIGRVMAMMSVDPSKDKILTSLLNQRARLVGAAVNKLEALRVIMKSRLHTSHTLFYCGDGSVEDSTSQESYRQLEAVTRLLGYELGYRVNTYTAETTLQEREDLRRQFESGQLQGLVAIRCLDEGVDIPAIETAVILASSGNPRQFIQRRGRVLRPCRNKHRAIIFDMIVCPPDLGEENVNIERSLLRKELVRYIEFARLADNAGEAGVQLLHLQRRYGLLDL
jgi:DNA phosphorothioation system restriction enzyme